MNIAVYCSANDDIAEEYYAEAKAVGAWIAAKGHTLVWGAGNCGLMGAVGEAVKAGGGRTMGMVPRVMESRHRVFRDIDVYFPCDDLSDRKALMLSHSDAAIALAGGIGTLDEVFSQAGAMTAGFHHKPVVLYSETGFWQPLTAMLDTMQRQGMMREPWRENIHTATSIDELESFLASAL